MASRNVPGRALNPYAPPTASADIRAGGEAEVTEQLANRSTRFASAMVDGVLAMIAILPALVEAASSGLLQQAKQGKEISPYWMFGTSPAQLVSTAAWISLMAVQAYLICTSGQSIGKRLTGIQIVKKNGSLPGFADGVLLRTWLVGLLGYVPGLRQLAGLVAIIDALFIFRGDRRCLHDMIAGTKVIRKQPKQRESADADEDEDEDDDGARPDSPARRRGRVRHRRS
ncbi:RDD family protein [Sorangium sp. So ce426]|uniref:RDD family protein n=1 Tax=unclassified Sorangium TaxID=2621164 RepID=UPI003F5C116A